MQERMILLVEDNPDDEKLTLRAMKTNNLANPIEIARDGQAAVDFLLDPSRPLPSLILLDLKLPKIGGLEVLRRARASERTRLVPIVVLTSSKEDTDLVASYDLGCNSYIRKPVDFDKFVEAVGQLGLYWMMLNESPPNVVRGPAAARKA